MKRCSPATPPVPPTRRYAPTTKCGSPPSARVFALYERANILNRHPWIADLLLWRARRSPRVLRRMASVLDETGNPGQLITAKGLLRPLTESAGAPFSIAQLGA